MTTDDVFAELDRLERNDHTAALDLYRRALRAGVAWNGLATSMARMQDDALAFAKALADVEREERAAKGGA